MEMAEYFKNQGYITEDISKKLFQVPRDIQTIKQIILDAIINGWKDAEEMNENITKRTLASRDDDSFKDLHQQLEGRNECILN